MVNVESMRKEYEEYKSKREEIIQRLAAMEKEKNDMITEYNYLTGKIDAYDGILHKYAPVEEEEA